MSEQESKSSNEGFDFAGALSQMLAQQEVIMDQLSRFDTRLSALEEKPTESKPVSEASTSTTVSDVKVSTATAEATATAAATKVEAKEVKASAVSNAANESSDFEYGDAFEDSVDANIENSNSTFLNRNKKVGDNDRRLTMFEKQADQIKTQAQPLQFHATQPGHNIALTALTVKQAFTFFESLEEYQTVWSIKLHAPSLLDQKVRQRLIAKYPHTLRGHKFFQLDDQALYALVQEFVRPESKNDFIVLLQRNVDFEIRSSYRPSAENFRVLYDAILRYKYVFLKTYELLAKDNSDNVPECKNKPNGLIKCFVEKIPFQYGDKVISNFASTKFEKIYEFLKVFSKTLELHLEGHKKALQIVRCFGGTEYEHKKPKPESLNNIAEFEEDAPLERPCFEDDVYDDEEDLPPEPLPDTSEADDELVFDQELAAMQDSVQPCWSKAMYGKCSRVKCGYDHGDAAMSRQRQTFIDQIRKLQQPAPKVSVTNTRFPTKN